jgi:hypothetical protein
MIGIDAINASSAKRTPICGPEKSVARRFCSRGMVRCNTIGLSLLLPTEERSLRGQSSLICGWHRPPHRLERSHEGQSRRPTRTEPTTWYDNRRRMGSAACGYECLFICGDGRVGFDLDFVANRRLLRVGSSRPAISPRRIAIADLLIPSAANRATL